MHIFGGGKMPPGTTPTFPGSFETAIEAASMPPPPHPTTSMPPPPRPNAKVKKAHTSVDPRFALPPLEEELEMIHCSKVRGPLSDPTYDFFQPNARVSPNLDLHAVDSSLYFRGGVVLRVTNAHNGLDHDVMLCDADVCSVCSSGQSGGEMGTSQFLGLPSCHVEDVSSPDGKMNLRRGGAEDDFDWAVLQGARFSTSVDVRCEMEQCRVSFLAGGRRLVVDALVCKKGTCLMCFGRGP
jgi:hypothetical protein